VPRGGHGVRRALILDLDVHGGNGAAAIFARDQSVLTLSIRGVRNYLFQRETSSLDVALADACEDDASLRALDGPLNAPAHRPNAVFDRAGSTRSPVIGWGACPMVGYVRAPRASHRFVAISARRSR
jgi:acetoin utilization deacetylase AcuC-like enzyme